jgi:hypothetical protein
MKLIENKTTWIARGGGDFEYYATVLQIRSTHCCGQRVNFTPRFSRVKMLGTNNKQ